ncbi:MAG: AMP-binding protein [Moraxella sp.]|nr:AMP-binding protein [Moraxella sp.]
MNTENTAPTQKVWHSILDKHQLKKEIELPDDNSSLLEMFTDNAKKFAERTAFIQGTHRLSFTTLDQYSTALAQFLQSSGLATGERVAIMLPNSLQYPVAVQAILKAGLVIVNVNPLYTAFELKHQLNDAGAKAIIVWDMACQTLSQIVNETGICQVFVSKINDLYDGIDENLPENLPDNLPKVTALGQAIATGKSEQYTRPAVNLNSVAVLQYTGGTTGLSKGATLTHRNLVANVLQMNEWFSPKLGGRGDVAAAYPFFCALPLYHIFTFTACQLFGMYKGQMNILIANPRDIGTMIDAMREHRPAFFPSVNTLYNALVNNDDFARLDHSRLGLAVGGGMSVLPATAEKWQKITGHTIIEAYGLSETSPLATANPVSHTHFSAMIGVGVSSTDIAILDDDGNIVPAGAMDADGELIAGEIAIKGPQVMTGYWNKPDETAKVMTADGYFRTGDVGVMDKDGFVKIVDRKKDMILVSGFNVYPNEIESIITKHPKVLEAAAIGVPDEHSGEVPKIFVVKKDESLTADELIAYTKEFLTGYKIPRQVEFITELPKSNVGKILRKNLRT